MEKIKMSEERVLTGKFKIHPDNCYYSVEFVINGNREETIWLLKKAQTNAIYRFKFASDDWIEGKLALDWNDESIFITIGDYSAKVDRRHYYLPCYKTNWTDKQNPEPEAVHDSTRRVILALCRRILRDEETEQGADPALFEICHKMVTEYNRTN